MPDGDLEVIHHPGPGVSRREPRCQRICPFGLRLLLLVIVVLGWRLARRFRSVPLDLSGTVALPDVIIRIKDRDEIAYPAHATLATILAVIRGAPVAVGLQWLKAAAHARTPAERERAIRGLQASRLRSRDPEEFATILRRYVRPGETAQFMLLARLNSSLPGERTLTVGSG